MISKLEIEKVTWALYDSRMHWAVKAFVISRVADVLVLSKRNETFCLDRNHTPTTSAIFKSLNGHWMLRSAEPVRSGGDLNCTKLCLSALDTFNTLEQVGLDIMRFSIIFTWTKCLQYEDAADLACGASLNPRDMTLVERWNIKAGIKSRF